MAQENQWKVLASEAQEAARDLSTVGAQVDDLKECYLYHVAADLQLKLAETYKKMAAGAVPEIELGKK